VTAGWFFLRTELRRRWRSWLLLAVIVGVFAGAVQSAAAGARRTDAAYPSLVAWSHAPDVLLFSAPGPAGTFASFSGRIASQLPQVAQAGLLASYQVTAPAAADLVVPSSNVIPGRFWHRRILAGRLPDPSRADEVDISFTVAQEAHLGVGDMLPIRLLAPDGTSVPVSFRIVGIDAAPGEFPPQTGTGNDVVWGTPAFYRAHRSGLDSAVTIALRLRHGVADWPAVQAAVSRLAHGKFVQSFPLANQTVNTERSIHLQAVALCLLSALLGVIGLLVLGQLLARQSYLDAADYATLAALGMSRRWLAAAGLGRAVVIGAAGAVAGAVIAVAASPLLPVGLAGVAEPHPGLHADGLVLGVGALITILVTMAVAAWPSWRAASTSRARAGHAPASRSRRPRLAAALTSGVRSVTAVIGVRLALQPGAGRTALPVRSTIASAVVGVAALSASLVFTASLSHLLATPPLYGVTWDAYVSNLRNTGVTSAVRGLNSDPGVTAWATGYSGVPVSIGGVRADAIAMAPGHGGSVLPVPVQGRLPHGPGELAIGQRTLTALHTSIGATVRVALGSFRPRPFRIVGVAVFPTMSDTLGLGKGAAFTVPGLRSLLPPGVPAPPPDTLLVRFRPPARGAAGLSAFASREAQLGPFAVAGPATPTDVVNFGRVQQLPLLLGVALSLLALLTIVHLLLTSVRRRRRDFAVLRSLGFTGGQVRGAVSWQAGTLTAAALCVGLPAGILCGRLAWRVFSQQLGILPVVVVPVAALAALTGAALLIAAAVAAVPGESAARARPASILRSE